MACPTIAVEHRHHPRENGTGQGQRLFAGRDVDAAGPPSEEHDPPAGSKSVEELAEIVQLAERPFIVKGVMTVKGALKAAGRCRRQGVQPRRLRAAGSAPCHRRGAAGDRRSPWRAPA